MLLGRGLVDSTDFIRLFVNNFNTSQMRSNFSKRMSVGAATPNVSHQDVPNWAIKDLQKTIDPLNHLGGKNKCFCELCVKGNDRKNRSSDNKIFHSNSKENSKWLKRVLEGLTLSGARSIKLFLPDILFVSGESLQVFQSSRKDGRVIRLSGLIPLRTIYPTFLRLRRQYKNLLQQNYNQKMLDKIDPQFMHAKYFNKLLPSHFNAGNDSVALDNNRHQFKKYVLHTSRQYEIQQLQEHKLNQNEPFCIIKYVDGNSQLVSQAQFEAYSLSSISKLQEAFYFQSYIRYKQQTQSIYYSEYTYNALQINVDLDQQAEQEIMVLLGAINKFDDDYKDIDTLEQIGIDLMFSKPKQYVSLMAYKIVHYLAMASRIYISHIKIKWILNDIGNIYLQEVMELETTDHPHRFIKFKLPQRDEALDFYTAGNQFVDIYKDMKKRKAINTLIIRKEIDKKSYNQIIDIIDPQRKQEIKETKDAQSVNMQRRRLPECDTYKTIQVSSARNTQHSPNALRALDVRKRYLDHGTYEQHLKQHPQIVMKHRRYNSINLGRYSEAPQKMEQVDKKINNHFTFNMSSEDYKTFGANSPTAITSRPNKIIDEYLVHRHSKASKSLLYNTFYQINSVRLKQASLTLDSEKIKENKNLRRSPK